MSSDFKKYIINKLDYNLEIDIYDNYVDFNLIDKNDDGKYTGKLFFNTIKDIKLKSYFIALPDEFYNILEVNDYVEKSIKDNNTYYKINLFVKRLNNNLIIDLYECKIDENKENIKDKLIIEKLTKEVKSLKQTIVLLNKMAKECYCTRWSEMIEPKNMGKLNLIFDNEIDDEPEHICLTDYDIYNKYIKNSLNLEKVNFLKSIDNNLNNYIRNNISENETILCEEYYNNTNLDYYKKLNIYIKYMLKFYNLMFYDYSELNRYNNEILSLKNNISLEFIPILNINNCNINFLYNDSTDINIKKKNKLKSKVSKNTDYEYEAVIKATDDKHKKTIEQYDIDDNKIKDLSRGDILINFTDNTFIYICNDNTKLQDQIYKSFKFDNKKKYYYIDTCILIYIDNKKVL